MKKTTAPSPGSLILNQRKKGDKKKNTRGQPTLNIVTHPKLKTTAETTQGKRSLYSLKLKTNVKSKDKTGTTNLKAAKEEKVKTYLQVSLFSFLQKMK